MTLEEYRRFARYWERHPPLHLLVAAFLGVRPKSDAPPAGDLGTLLAMAPGGVMHLAGPAG